MGVQLKPRNKKLCRTHGMTEASRAKIQNGPWPCFRLRCVIFSPGGFIRFGIKRLIHPRVSAGRVSLNLSRPKIGFG